MDSKKHNKYCWVCCGKETSLSCSKCLRVFHEKCIEKYDWVIVGNKFRCWVCFKAQQHYQKDKQSELDMLPVVIDQVWNDKQFESIKDILRDGIYPGASSGVIVNPISLTSISDNIKAYLDPS
ncbi:uncharacterized protein LOC116351288 [Contarinia nasturtii]|uniref:uncharacterized protein LOC116351288 n=1 Tax=Contarinia nasturtii TaxID=265458 RepID=UPI0012D3DC3D|nr:uncharacterized protein LOC116351288 [Contarinia nasturtii]